MALVTADTNRVDSFAKAHGISEQNLIRWNINYFIDNRTFWLPIGENLFVEAPRTGLGHLLLTDGNILLVNGGRLVLN